MQEEPLEMYFPMWLVPGKVLMQLQHPLPAHEQLVQDKMLVRWQMPHSRLVIFASRRHQSPCSERENESHQVIFAGVKGVMNHE